MRPLKLPTEAPEETVVGAPTWLVAGWAGVSGDRAAQVKGGTPAHPHTEPHPHTRTPAAAVGTVNNTPAHLLPPRAL
eukprot:5914982-Pyramimonas_sp.AAC.1